MPAAEITQPNNQQICYCPKICMILHLSSKSNIMRKAVSKGISLNAFFKNFTSALRSLFLASDNDDFMRLKKFIC